MRQKEFTPTLIIFVLAILGVATFYIYKNVQTKPSVTPEPILNWQLYVNKEHHISFRHPSALIQKCGADVLPANTNRAEIPSQAADGTEKFCVSIGEITTGAIGLDAEINFVSKPVTQTLSGSVPANIRADSRKETQLSVDGKPAISIITNSEGETLTKFVFIEQSSTSIIKITGNYGAESKILDQILSTFKFVN